VVIGMASGILVLVGSVVTGLFLWSKNLADGALSISKASEALVNQLDHRREKDMARIERQDGKLHKQALIIGALITGNIAINRWIQTVSEILSSSGIKDIPPPPEVTIDVGNLEID